MCRTKDLQKLELKNFALPFEMNLDEHNRWIERAKFIFWNMFNEVCVQHFTDEEMGAPENP